MQVHRRPERRIPTVCVFIHPNTIASYSEEFDMKDCLALPCFKHALSV